MITSEFEIDVPGHRLTCLLAEPQRGSLAADPALLLTFSSIRREAIEKPPYNAAARRFVERGHRALSFDLPNHGDRAARDQGSELAAMCDSLLEGDDPFATFVRDGIAVIDSCITRQVARPGRILLYGVSRGGYCAIRLAAADHRVTAVAAIAPVTDWRVLQEFSGSRNNSIVAALALENYAEALTEKCVYVIIGDHDERVGTDRCAAFVQSLLEIKATKRGAGPRLEFHIVSDGVAHALPEDCYAAAAEYLLREIDRE